MAKAPIPYTSIINAVHTNNRLDSAPKGMEGGMVSDLRRLRALSPDAYGHAAPSAKGHALAGALRPKFRLPKPPRIG